MQYAWQHGGEDSILLAGVALVVIVADHCIDARNCDVDCGLHCTCRNADRGRSYRNGGPGNGNNRASVQSESKQQSGDERARPEPARAGWCRSAVVLIRWQPSASVTVVME